MRGCFADVRTEHPCLAAEYGLRRRRIGDVQYHRIQMYPSPHFAGGLGAAECPGAMAAREHPKSDSYSDSKSNANADSITYTNS